MTALIVLGCLMVGGTFGIVIAALCANAAQADRAAETPYCPDCDAADD